MGGIGSTRWRDHTRSATIEEGHLRLRIAQLRGLLARPNGGERTLDWPTMSLTATVTHRPDLIQDTGWLSAELTLSGSWILLRGEPGQLAGTRWWFSCLRCGEKRESLFTEPILLGEMWDSAAHNREPAREWKCRDCSGLVYQIGQLGALQRADHRIRKIVRQARRKRTTVGRRDAASTACPRGMHAAVYRSLCTEYAKATEAYEKMWLRSAIADGKALRCRRAISEHVWRFG